MKTIIAIDQGTTGSTIFAMDENLNELAQASVDFKQYFPKPGWVEHDTNDIYSSVLECLKQVVQKIDVKSIVAIGITNQRETVCFWNSKSGEALSHAIVWQDRRTFEFCNELKAQNHEETFQKRTGLLLDPYFSGTKISWALKNWEKVKEAQSKNELAVGTIDSFILNKLTAGLVHATEPSNASRTLAFDIHDLKWSETLCNTLQIPIEILPKVKPSMGVFGKTKNVPGLPDGIPISGILGDQQSALLGQACVEEGTAKCTYGTGAFMLLNTGSRPVASKHRLLTTVAWQLPDLTTTYALEGSAFIAGAAVQWLRDGLGLFKDSAEIESLAKQVDSADGVTFVPALTGLGAPYWDPNATGLFTGITRGTNRAHFARAVLNGIALQNADILTAMQSDLSQPLKSLNVDGGASANNLLMQIQSDVLGINLQRPKFTESTSLGAVFAAGIGVGVWKNFDEIKKAWKKDREFSPVINQAEKTKMIADWKLAIKKTLTH